MSWVRNALAAETPQKPRSSLQSSAEVVVAPQLPEEDMDKKQSSGDAVDASQPQEDFMHEKKSNGEVFGLPQSQEDAIDEKQSTVEAVVAPQPQEERDDEQTKQSWNIGDIGKLHGRVGRLLQCPDSFNRVRMEYADGTQSSYVGIGEIERGTMDEWCEDELAALSAEVFEAEEVKKAEAEVLAVEASIAQERKLAEKRIRKSLVSISRKSFFYDCREEESDDEDAKLGAALRNALPEEGSLPSTDEALVVPQLQVEGTDMNEEETAQSWNIGDIAKLHGRVGKLSQGPDSFNRVRMEYADGTQSSYVGIGEIGRGTADEWHQAELEILSAEALEAEEVKKAEAEVLAVEISIAEERRLAEKRIRKSLVCIGELPSEDSDDEDARLENTVARSEFFGAMMKCAMSPKQGAKKESKDKNREAQRKRKRIVNPYAEVGEDVVQRDQRRRGGKQKAKESGRAVARIPKRSRDTLSDDDTPPRALSSAATAAALEVLPGATQEIFEAPDAPEAGLLTTPPAPDTFLRRCSNPRRLSYPEEPLCATADEEKTL